MLRSTRPPSQETVLTSLINDLADHDQDLVIVLDDLHAIQADPPRSALSYLIDHLPSHIHLVLSGRADPDLSLARLRAGEDLCELREADLRFSPDEAISFLRGWEDIDVEDVDLARLIDRTEGWPAGLHLAALAMKQHPEPRAFLASFAGSTEYIGDYLIEEVLAAQPEELQMFLLQTSILKQLKPSLCEAVTGRAGAAETLERIDKSNLFIVRLDEGAGWYRYHRLFADLLRSRLRMQYPGTLPALHGRASEWYADHGMLEEAIVHALESGDDASAADLLERAAERLFVRSELASFREWVSRLSTSSVRARPNLLVWHAGAKALSGADATEVEALLEEIEAGEPTVADLGVIAAVRASMATLQGDAAASLRQSQQALERLPEDSVFWRGITLDNLGIAQIMAGDLAAATQSLQRSAQLAKRTGNIFTAVGAMTNLAGLLVSAGQLNRAEPLLREALDLARDSRGRPLPIAGKAMLGMAEIYREHDQLDQAAEFSERSVELLERSLEFGATIGLLTLSRVRIAQGDLDQAQANVDRARDLSLASQGTAMDDFLVEAQQTRVWLAKGDLESAAAWAAQKSPPEGAQRAESQAGFYHLHEAEQLTLARVFLALDRFGEALDILDQALREAERRQQFRRVIEIQALRALALDRMGQRDRALEAVGRSLELGQPRGFLRTFLDEGLPLAKLLYEAASQGVHSTYAGKLLAAFPEVSDLAEKPPSEDLVEPLSDRELDVLELIAEGRSNQEIAQKLFIALRTVKWHSSNIYAKLGVKNRTQAVTKARRLGVLPRS